MIRRAVFVSFLLASVVVLGLVVVPALVSQGGVLVYSGNGFTYSSSDFLDIPFVVGHHSQLSGSFQSSSPSYLYLLNHSQFWKFDGDGGYCPIQGVSPLLFNVTHASIAASVENGSYSLIFCTNFQAPSTYDVQVQITSPIQVSS